MPLALVVVLLVGSVLIPAGQTWRIMRLLRETGEVVEPARLSEARLEFGLAMESATLQGYALSGEDGLLTRYREAVADDERRLTRLEELAGNLDREAVEYVTAVRSRIDAWRQLNRALSEGRLSRAQWASAATTQQAGYDVALDEMTRLATYLASESATRRDQVRLAERLSLVVNASLVLVALAAVFAVAALINRERRLTLILRRRITDEAALREAAQSLAAAFTVGEVTQQLASSALLTTEGRGAIVEQVGPGPNATSDVVTVSAAAGTGVPATGTAASFSGSLTERVLQGGEPVLIQDLSRVEQPCAANTISGGASSAIVIPLGQANAPIGALFILGASPRSFGPDDLVRARTFGHIAALAYEKVRLLDDARAGRAQLERVMQSRSRLMRGFSHDVKNPLGAADGYAALLADGIFGSLGAEQRRSIDRIRRSIGVALALIDDLHELARAETGHLALAIGLVDLGALVHAIGDEYEAAASAHGLSLVVEAAADSTMIETDGARVRQIIGNLLSNAIKYTNAGSVTLRVRHASPDTADAAGRVAIAVIDTGPGIPREKQHGVFEEFSRLGVVDKPGAGLGLAISQRLAHALGGEITLESEVGRGSTFALHLPARPRDGMVTPAAAQVAREAGAHAVTSAADNSSSRTVDPPRA